MLNDHRKVVVDSSTIESDLKALATNSKALNRLTDELTKHVDDIESAVNALNIGLFVAVNVDDSSDLDGMRTHYVRLLYLKEDGRWGFGIDEFDEDEGDPDRWQNHQSWVFKDAPRALRLKVVHMIPALIKALVKESEELTAKTTTAVAHVQVIAAKFSKSAAPAGPGK